MTLYLKLIDTPSLESCAQEVISIANTNVYLIEIIIPFLFSTQVNSTPIKTTTLLDKFLFSRFSAWLGCIQILLSVRQAQRTSNHCCHKPGQLPFPYSFSYRRFDSSASSTCNCNARILLATMLLHALRRPCQQC